MSLRLAALDAYGALSAILAHGWYNNPDRITDNFDLLADTRRQLRTALGIAPIYAEHERPLDKIALTEAIAESLARSPDTALLAGAIIRAIGQHRAEQLAPRLAAE